MEREHASRLQEAESAVRRLQVEFEHQIELERSRNMEVVRQRQAAEARATSLEQRCAAIEQAFIDFRARQRSTPEAEMQAQLSEALAARHAAEERAGRLARCLAWLPCTLGHTQCCSCAVVCALSRRAWFLPAPCRRAKRHYKEQVVRLAKDLAALQAESLKERERWLAKERRTLDTVAFARAAQEQLRLTQDAQKELREIRGRLAAMAGEPGGEAAAAGADADGAEGEQVINGAGDEPVALLPSPCVATVPRRCRAHDESVCPCRSGIHGSAEAVAWTRLQLQGRRRRGGRMQAARGRTSQRFDACWRRRPSCWPRVSTRGKIL